MQGWSGPFGRDLLDAGLDAVEGRIMTFRVLVVDDTQLNRLLAVAMLEKLGYEVGRASNGQEATDALALMQYDAVLMDIQMPGIDGFSATKTIRRRESLTGYHTPIIGLSARTMSGDRETAIAAGMDDYLTKPLQFEELSDMLDRLIKAGAQIT
jgi:CheY-like chemotaxis protein